MGRYQITAVNSFIVCILVGLVCGVISAFGIGGGSLLMIWLTAVMSMDQRLSQGINLLYFIPTAVAALIVHSKNNLVKWSVALPAIACGAVTAAIFAWIGNQMELNLLRKLFGGFLIIIGIIELFKKQKKEDAPAKQER